MGPSKNQYKRRGIRVFDPTPDAQAVLSQAVKQDLRDPEDSGNPMPENRLKKYGQTPGSWNG